MNIIEFTEKHLVTFVKPSCTWSDGVVLQDYEKDFLNSLVDNKETINVASRQMHMSTLLCAFAAYKLIFGEDIKISFLDIRRDLVFERINGIRLIIDNFIKKSQSNLNFSIDTKKELRLSNGNSVIGITNTDGFRGRATNIIIIDNAAFIHDLEQIYAALIPTMKTSTAVHLVSSANGINYFHRILTGHNGFKKNYYHYSLNSRYTPESIEHFKQLMDDRSWKQEMEMQFFNPLQTNRTRVLQVRVNGETYIEVAKRLIELDVNLSEYLHNLINKDLYRG